MGKNHYFRKQFALRRLKKMMARKKSQSVLVVLEGPHGSGKSIIAHKFAKKHKRTTILTCRDVIRMAIGKKESDGLVSSNSSLGECFIIDDVEFLRGREQTQERIVHLIQNWREKGAHIIISGVDVRNRLPKFMELLGDTDLVIDLT